MPLVCSHHPPRGAHIPQAGDAICAAAGQEAPVWAEVERIDVAAVRLERVQSLPPGDIPEADRLVDPDRGKGLAIRAKREMVDRIRMAQEGMEGLAAAYIPQAGK